MFSAFVAIAPSTPRPVRAAASGILSLSLLLSLSAMVQAQTTPVAPATPAVAQTTPTTPTAVVAPAAPARGGTAFTQTVLKNFDAWDTDHDGVLSEKEIDTRLLDPTLTDEQGAAIGAIKIAMRSGKFILPPITKEYFHLYVEDVRHRQKEAPAAKTPAESTSLPNPETEILPNASTPATTTGGPKPTTSLANPAPTTAFPHYTTTYLTGLKRIKATPKDIYAPGTTLSLDSIHQGQIGDCYLLSVLGGMIQRDPTSISKLARANPDGSCDVTLPSGMTTHITAVTDAEVAVSSGDAGTGRWLPALEEAYGRFRVRAKTGATTDAADEIGTDNSTKGGSVRKTLQDFTGHKVGTVSFRKRGHAQEMPSVEDVTPKLPSVRRAIAEALKDHRLVAAGTGTALPLPPAVNGKHAYAVIKFDETADTITLWNPHNNNFIPTGEPGLTTGYPTKGGVFTMPLVEFARVYPSISWEMVEPLGTPTAAPATATPAPAVPATTTTTTAIPAVAPAATPSVAPATAH